MPRVAANGIEIEYIERGEGEPLLLIMGLGCQLIHWHPDWIELLAQSGYRVVAFDNRDSGLSTRCTGRVRWRDIALRSAVGMTAPAPYSLSDMAADGVALLDALGIERAHLFGLSMGGMIAQTIAIEHPERVRSISSVMSSPGGLRHLITRPRAMRSLFGPVPRNADQAVEFVVRHWRDTGGSVHRHETDYLRDLARRAWERGHYPAGFVRQLGAIVSSGSRLRRLRALKVPAMVVHGEEDPLVLPSAGRATARAIPGARLRMIAGMGHEMAPSVWPTVLEELTAVTEAAASDRGNDAGDQSRSRNARKSSAS